MSATKGSKKITMYLYIVLTIGGCVLACSTIIPNDYLKLLVVMVSLVFGLYGIMKSLSNNSAEETTPSTEEK